MVRCGLGMQQCAMHNATIQKTTCFEMGVYVLLLDSTTEMEKGRGFICILSSLNKVV